MRVEHALIHRKERGLVRRARSVRDFLAHEALVVLAVAGIVTALAIAMPKMVVPDTWLALVDGRWIADHGLPHTDSIALWTRHVEWVDQQWLAHLFLYELAHIGGTKLVLFVALAIDIAAVCVAAYGARLAGASQRSTALCLLTAFLVAPWLLQARTQTLALPLFVAVYVLLAADARRASRGVFFVFPLLVLSANLHGSAALAAALVVLHGLLTLRREPLKGIGLSALAPLCLLASPYGIDVVGYYHRLLIGSPLPSYVDEWAPTKLEADTVAFFGLTFVTVVLLARHARSTTLFERFALPALILVGLLAGRNTGWLGLGFAVSGPFLVDAAWSPARLLDERIPRLNVGLSSVAIGIAALALLVRAVESESSLLDSWRNAGARAVATAAGPSGLVLADDLHSDWLLWRRPELTGRVAYDVRFELLSEPRLRALQAFQEGLAPKSFVLPYRVLTFASAADASRLAPAATVVYQDPEFVVVRRG